jgi:hypothetical protein
LWQEGFLEPLRCDLHPELLDTLGKRVVGLMDSGFFRNDPSSERLQRDPNAGVLLHANKVGMRIREKFQNAHIHPDKLSPEMRSLAMRAGLADIHSEKLSPALQEFLSELSFSRMHPEKLSLKLQHLMRRSRLSSQNDGEWLLVDSQFAEVYMSALAAILSKEAGLAALTSEEPSMGVNLQSLLDDVKPSAHSDKKGALVSFVMQAIKVDPNTRIDKLLAFRRSHKNQLAELTAQFEDLSSKITTSESGIELQELAKDAYVTRIHPKLAALKGELRDCSIQSVWEGMQRAVTVTAPAGGALAYFTGLTGNMLLAAGAAIAVTDVAIKTHLARNKARRASPYTYLLDVERKFSID